jgi:hypothetical protein
MTVRNNAKKWGVGGWVVICIGVRGGGGGVAVNYNPGVIYIAPGTPANHSVRSG